MRALVAAAAMTLAAGVATSELRWTRTVTADRPGPVAIEPDGPMFEHARVGFADLRVVDANGAQVPWRTAPPPPTSGLQQAILLNSGRRGGAAVALLDLGPRRAVRDRIELDVPDRGFVGRVVVLGADGREGPFTRLSATGIYDVAGAARARSTTALFPPTDFRFLSIRATGVSRIEGAIVSGTEGRLPSVERTPRRISTRRSGRRTIVTLDFGYRNVPIDELRLSARSPRYNRAAVVEAANDRFGRRWVPMAAARIARFEGSSPSPIPVGARARYVRVKIENGDDPPLVGISVAASSRSHALVLEGGHPRPYRLLYGSPGLRAPDYEFARIPLDPNGAPARGTLGPERRNPAFELQGKSFAERHGWLLQGALVLAAIAVAGAGFLALRRRT